MRQAQSRLGASLLPKLRDQFAEFLNEGYPVRLGAFTPAHLSRNAVRVAVYYRPCFSGRSGLSAIVIGKKPPTYNHPSPARRRATGLDLGNSSARQRLPCRAHDRMGTYTHQYRNINRLSIAYGYYALGLGPTNPTRTFLASETLGIRRARFSHA